jgi:hypothetical protein
MAGIRTPQRTPATLAAGSATAPQTTGYDPLAAIARIEALRAEGLSLAKIAAQLNAEGVPTRQGEPWGKARVG